MPTESRPQRRPRSKGGTHSILLSQRFPAVLCNGNTHPIWFTRNGPRCNHCWHVLDEAAAVEATDYLHVTIRSIVGSHSNLVADDLDDSTEGLKQLGIKITTRLRYLNLTPAPRQRRLFRIASLLIDLHRLDENGTLTHEQRFEAAARLSSKTETEIAELVKVAVK